MNTWKFDSSRGEKDKYTVVLDDDGKLGCNCRGWTIRKGEKPRECTHTKDTVTNNNMTVEARGEFIYVVGSPILQPVAPQNKKSTGVPVGYVSPMLAVGMTLGKTIADFENDNFSMEVKFNGHRLTSVKLADIVQTWKRPKDAPVGNPFTLPGHILKELLKFLDCGLDGELVGGGGDDDQSYHVTRLDKSGQLKYVVFDVTSLGGESTTHLPLVERRQLLAQLFKQAGKLKHVLMSEAFKVSQKGVQAVWDAGGEGVIIKRVKPLAATKYQPGHRSADWVKMKREFAVGCVITGFLKGENGPYSKVALLSDEGVVTSAKTKDNAWLAKFKADPDKYIGARLVITHYGKTPKGKYQGPIIFDHMAGEGE
jgi:hypothetical protein